MTAIRMLDIKCIRENPEKVKWALEIKKIRLDLDTFLKLDAERSALIQELDTLKQEKNKNAFLIKSLPKVRQEIHYNQKGERTVNEQKIDRSTYVEKGKRIKEQIQEKKKKFQIIENDYLTFMAHMPTVPAPDTPLGKDDSENIEVLKKGEPTKFDFTPKDHIQLGKDLDLLDLERGVKVSGYRGYYVKNEAVLLQMGAMMYALQKVIAKGFRPMIPPTLVREFALWGSGYFNGREYDPEHDEIYQIANDDKLADGSTKRENKFLVGTAEPSMLAYYADEVLDASDLPLKLCGFSQCYRSEIGSYGQDTKGMYRVHEFMKVELVCIAPADIALADQLQEEMIAISRELHEDLGLPYRQLRMCSGDLSVGKYKQYDLEAWIPSRNGYGETGSASNFLDWQSRRLNVRYRDQSGKMQPVYMLNDTALPSPRILIAIMENYQQKDGSIRVPEVLVPYVGKKIIRNKGKGGR